MSNSMSLAGAVNRLGADADALYAELQTTRVFIHPLKWWRLGNVYHATVDALMEVTTFLLARQGHADNYLWSPEHGIIAKGYVNDVSR